jgi:predicted RNA-binding protein with PIN domain
VVDGNNLMGQRPGWWRNKRAAQSSLVERVADYADHQGLAVLLVFDGRPAADLPDRTLYRGVLLRYARRGATADDLIAEIAGEIAKVESAIVVTSDRELGRRVGAAGVQVLRTGIFRRRIEALES